MNIYENLFGSERRKLLLYGFYFRPFFTDNKTWSGSMNIDFCFVRSALNLYLRNTRTIKAFLQIFPDGEIFMQIFCIVGFRVPLGVPCFYNAKPETYWMYFLSQTTPPEK